MAAILKIYFSLLLLNRKANWLQTCWEASGWLKDQKELKSCPSEIQDGCHGSHLENLFFASSPEPKGQLTPNLLGSIRVTCRSKIAKIVPIGNPRWPPWPPSWKSIFCFFSWTERPIDSKLDRKHQGDCRSKIAKIVLIRNPRWPPSWKSIFRFFSWTERPNDSKLARKHQGDL